MGAQMTGGGAMGGGGGAGGASQGVPQKAAPVMQSGAGMGASQGGQMNKPGAMGGASAMTQPGALSGSKLDAPYTAMPAAPDVSRRPLVTGAAPSPMAPSPYVSRAAGGQATLGSFAARPGAGQNHGGKNTFARAMGPAQYDPHAILGQLGASSIGQR